MNLVSKLKTLAFGAVLAGSLIGAKSADAQMGLWDFFPSSNSEYFCSPEKNYAPFNNLIKYLNENGFGVQELIANPNFKIYKNLKKEYENFPEKKSKTQEAYERTLGIGEKKAHIREFLEKYSDELDFAQEKYGISKYIIASILGVESDFGKRAGESNPVDAFFSMYLENFDKSFAKKELVRLLNFCFYNNVNPFDIKSNEMGAIGYVQFEPSSLWLFVGHNWYNMKDDIFSVGNYLNHYLAKEDSMVWKGNNHNKSSMVIMKKVIGDYNHSDKYVQAVLDLAHFGKEVDPK